ncbi:MAG: leucine-rich repeat domain-containing protein [Prevotellaceae bacterium]|nr:leucine-rich repeat domain-containing protein [Prevotellaceae bacterium]
MLEKSTFIFNIYKILNSLTPQKVNRDRAFAGCAGLTSMTISDGLTTIGWEVFSNCLGLTSITIPNGITSIGSRTFVGCSGLTTLTIPASVTLIEAGAFQGCTGLASVINHYWNDESFNLLYNGRSVSGISKYR